MNKYWPKSSYIGKHVDGHITDSFGNKSVRTILIYLNDCTEGNTILELHGQSISVKPQTGRALLMDQELTHEAGPPTIGYKYILRTDLFEGGHAVRKN